MPIHTQEKWPEKLFTTLPQVAAEMFAWQVASLCHAKAFAREIVRGSFLMLLIFVCKLN